MNAPNDRTYLLTHEWHKVDGDSVTIGLTQFAADELTDITYVALPKVGDRIEAGKRFGEVESVKATSDVYCGMAGTVTQINQELTANPGLINTDPFARGWIIRLKPDKIADVNALLTSDQYMAKIGH
jgi:glycine cleavage system H protein